MIQRISILMVVCLFCLAKGMAQCDSLVYHLIPFVKGGITGGLFEGEGNNDNSVGHTGYHIDIGLQVPFQRGSQYQCCLIPSLRFITKGDTWDMGESGRASINMQYIEMPVDFAYRVVIKKSCLLVGVGVYLAYGIGGKMTGSEGLYIYHGYRLKNQPAAFGSEIGIPRWDWGFNWMTEYQMRHFCLSADIDFGLVPVAPGKLVGNNQSKTMAISLGIGYMF
jgi:hypothetical protein